MSQFDEYALEKIRNLMATSDSQVGSNYAGDKSNKSQTSCITFVTQVLVYAYEKLDRKSVAEDVRKRTKKGTELAAYLATNRVWRAHYWNPDVQHPRDQADEHPFSYHKAVKTKEYYKIPLSGAIIDYAPTPLPKGTKRRTAALDRFKHVPFAVGIAWGGYHTFLCSYGKVYEVHWGKIGKELYEVSDFGKFTTKTYLSGVVVVPPKTSFDSSPL